MIHLDTNYLIGMVSLDSTIGGQVRHWLQAGEKLGTSAVAWSEFLTGPLSADQVRRAQVILNGEIASFGTAEAVTAADLYNRAGRKRDIRVDSMIAATALLAGARLATKNRKDFTPFLSSGLHLAT